MYVAEFQIDRSVPDGKIIAAFAVAFGVSRQDVSVWPSGMVDDRSAAVIIQKEAVGGDFPALLRVGTKEHLVVTADDAMLVLARSIAASLDAALITDDIGVNPLFDDDFLLVAPDGSTAVVQADLDILNGENPTIVLVPESRAIYESLVHRRLAAAG